jgi:pimeloyl-ACP methyl ester carboxylesterase
MIASALTLAASLGACRTMGGAPDLATSALATEHPISGCPPLADLEWIRTFPQLLPFDNRLGIRVGVVEPQGDVVGDVLFFPGFADRLDNHRPLFEEWSRAGLRVISFDYPSHGESCGSSLATYGIRDLAHIASYVEGITLQDPRRPLFLAGWSTGGLVATRIAQDPGSYRPSRDLAGLILLAPGVAVHALVGDWGHVTTETLTRNPAPPHYGTITPQSPLSVPTFATNLLVNAKLAFHALLPSSLPTLVVVGDDTGDKYARTPKIKDWIVKQRAVDPQRPLAAVQCVGGFHELDNEPEPMGGAVRDVVAAFPRAALAGTTATLAVAAACRKF